jgi:hypothetical protein
MGIQVVLIYLKKMVGLCLAGSNVLIAHDLRKESRVHYVHSHTAMLRKVVCVLRTRLLYT